MGRDDQRARSKGVFYHLIEAEAACPGEQHIRLPDGITRHITDDLPSKARALAPELRQGGLDLFREGHRLLDPLEEDEEVDLLDGGHLDAEDRHDRAELARLGEGGQVLRRIVVTQGEDLDAHLHRLEGEQRGQHPIVGAGGETAVVVQVNAYLHRLLPAGPGPWQPLQSGSDPW